ncbi:substrate-binding domain-containing protein [Roseimaritima ulvae]|uniref:D-ribose transporter subunit RbsB n=1 Tax=Roseimaritima ulvae TaxID=980254 RepID=A0A5B9QXB4_9BACT|nr:substrate-binding domain-containing protein [Roseimaritima ulvae]QEG42005.1 D-ribose transporter subunit RbsB [Roseimaritima ulvae]
MPIHHPSIALLLLTMLVCPIGCGRSAPGPGANATAVGSNTGSNANSQDRFPLEAGQYTVLGIMTDRQDNSLAKGNVESTLLQHPDVDCLVGLWSANTPAILAALDASDKTEPPQVVGFDEHDDTLKGIREGKVYGTIVQQPYAFGFRSVEFLTAIARGGEVPVPESGRIYIPYREITADNVQQFSDEVHAMNAGNGPVLDSMAEMGEGEQPVSVAFITNGTDPFWTLADKGCQKAAEHFQVEVEFQPPSTSTIEAQKRLLESNVVKQFDGIAISPIDPENQVAMINEACQAMPVICHDSDAPDSDRLFYLGTSNYMAGRAAGRMIKQAIPDGGKVMMFVGLMEVLNAQERSQGVIDELADKPIPEIYQGAE